LRTVLFILCFLQSFMSLAQSEYEFLGVIQLQEDSFISYKISFTEEKGTLTGHTITDMGGPHETKSYLSGYYDEKSNVLEFYESGIVYTKSFVNQNDFCFLHYSGELKRLNEKQHISGAFKGLYSDGKECINGEIHLKNYGKILKRAKKIDRKVERSILISQEKKDQVHLLRDLDSINTHRLNKNETLSMFAEGKTIFLTVYDAGQEDGDKIALSVNGTPLYQNLEALSEKKVIEIPLKKSKTELSVKALTNGTIGGNTVMLEIRDAKNKIETVTNLKKGESAKFVFLRNE